MNQDEFQAAVLQKLEGIEDFIEYQKKFNEKLFVVVENEIIDKIDTSTEGFQLYTDKKVEEHEQRFRYEPAAI